ncbi:hypothetical protein BRE01_39680 [Brevibacillus reuszeri]|uniref:Uncharacterized protein n=1 Tax=Brevibacillus reuszeri TaxID=54915 RepID=A0A0K9YVM3_9BACL|nr:hypothetical protein [Brevibacillus reuszeri]KNB72702.1 hypothetical protein ADS79_12715 [Brevibacillus reuszeri]MED1860598.1 hypothetical protein [Brevibacillus reuszeri]GED70266.1 hypothetical protein BRE01_39680 [Brevibacillus reuszeri]
MRIFEKISFYSDLDLIELSQKLERCLALSPFEYDAENENRWSWTYDQDHIQVNISWPYLSYKLQEWDQSVPDRCNYTMILMSDSPHVNDDTDKYGEAFVLSSLLPTYMSTLHELACHVYYHAGNHHQAYLAKHR